MQRIPEPELMDSEAQTAAYAAADFSESNSLFVSSFLQRFPDLPASGRVADLGCGPGDITVRLAKALPGWRLDGLDAGENMLKLARRRLETEGSPLEIEFRLSHLPDPSLDAGAWDALVSNSLLHHLPDPHALWASIGHMGRPGCVVLVMDLARPGTLTAAKQLVDQYSEGEPEVLREDFYNSLLAAYTVDEVGDQLRKAGLDRITVDMASDRHWIASGTLPG